MNDNKEKQTILVIGNGFDLAHDLKTSYNNFLEFLADEKSNYPNDHKLKEIVDANYYIQYLLGKGSDVAATLS